MFFVFNIGFTDSIDNFDAISYFSIKVTIKNKSGANTGATQTQRCHARVQVYIELRSSLYAVL